jgi:hypothetical protein
MKESNVKRKKDSTGDNQVLSVDCATLDSFYSLVASIAMRLTGSGKKSDTTGNATGTEGKQ